ncbi:hypothetical protein WICMUC_004392 [Wickerhamomyces mucosus]|uniref:Vesicular-fusion protein SEC18 n=1 Tax=Wickerhamomyces mucosus TaxID=1378264 RepID=A0A9P8PJ90_9ASCO|nr:hypothetical protein WICMUC_004392 [Wickerhamomyces mucosus]
MDKFGFGRSKNDANSDSNSVFGGGLANKLPFSHNRPFASSGPPKQMLVGNSPSNEYALANVASINQSDFEDGVYISINDTFVFTTRHSSSTPSGEIGLNGTQRAWGRLSFHQPIEVRKYDITDKLTKHPYISTLNVEISFKIKNKATTIQYDQDHLAKHFTKTFNAQILAPSQLLLMEFQGVIFEIRVQGIQSADIENIEISSPISTTIDTKSILVPQSVINFFKGDSLVNLKSSSVRPRSDAIIRPDFKFEDMGVGGLDKEFTQIFRRAFASRIFPPSIIEKLGISHVKGLLLFGPPGTGKTLIARRIGTMLNAKEPKIVNGPEILSKYVGSSEENIRNLFKDAEAEYKAKGEESSLHIIIFDELDSVFKQRGSRGDGTGVGDNVVNQLLAKMDGVDQLNNILVIGMTNRRDLIDNALLRPGRFEVQVEIQLPDEHGRFQIFEIQTSKMRGNKMLSSDVDLHELAALTKNFSGAEIEGLVKSASSFAINQKVNIGKGATKINNKDIANMRVTRQNFLDALNEVSPAFGVNEEDLKTCVEGGIFKFSHRIDDILKTGSRYVRQVRESDRTRLVSLVMHGPSGSGKTALAAAIALASKFPFVRLIAPEEMVGMSETAKIAYIDNTFRDSYKSPLNVLVVDSIETIVDWVPIGPRFSNNILQVLKVYLKRKPPKDRRLLIISTTSTYSVLQQMDLLSCFDNEIAVPNVTTFEELNNIMYDSGFLDDVSRGQILSQLKNISSKLNIGIKRALTNIETAKHDEDPVNEIVELMAESAGSSF